MFESFGPGLEKLTFFDCYGLDAATLVPFVNLKELHFYGGFYTTLEEMKAMLPDAETRFLPKLEKIVVEGGDDSRASDLVLFF